MVHTIVGYPSRGQAPEIPAMRLKMESKKLPDKPPPLIWLFQTIAKLGGWCDSKHTGRPGWLAVWKGWAKLQIGVEVWRMARQFWGVEM